MKARQLPNAIEAEQSVLGGMMLDQRAIAKVAPMLEPADFFRKDHAALYRAVLDLDARGDACDAVTVGEWLERNGLNGVISSGYVLQLANNTPSAANIMAYARIVKERSLQRCVIDLAGSLMESAFAPGDATPAEIVDNAVRDLMGLHRSTRVTEWTIRQAAQAAWESAESASRKPDGITGIPTGIPELDENMGGWHDSDLIVIGGRPKMGKTAFLIGSARHAARKGFPVGIISGEQAMRQIGARMLALDADVRASGMRNGIMSDEEWGALMKAVPRVGELRIILDDDSMPTLVGIKRTARRWKQEHGIKALYVDYLQKVRVDLGRDAREDQRIHAVAAGLKEIGRELDIPVIALAQVKQDVENRQDKRPRASDLAGSDGILREADIVVNLYRDKVYNPNSNTPDECELLIEANRHGGPGAVRTPWNAKTMRFGHLDF